MARTRYGFIGVIVRRDYLNGCVPNECEIEVSVAERLTVDGGNLHFVRGVSAEAVGKGQSGGLRNDRRDAEDEEEAYGGQ